jgi:hypothetical protein
MMVKARREATPFPPFPLNGEGEWSIWLEQEIINWNHEIRLPPKFRTSP